MKRCANSLGLKGGKRGRANKRFCKGATVVEALPLGMISFAVALAGFVAEAVLLRIVEDDVFEVPSVVASSTAVALDEELDELPKSRWKRDCVDGEGIAEAAVESFATLSDWGPTALFLDLRDDDEDVVFVKVALVLLLSVDSSPRKRDRRRPGAVVVTLESLVAAAPDDSDLTVLVDPPRTVVAWRQNDRLSAPTTVRRSHMNRECLGLHMVPVVMGTRWVKKVFW